MLAWPCQAHPSQQRPCGPQPGPQTLRQSKPGKYQTLPHRQPDDKPHITGYTLAVLAGITLQTRRFVRSVDVSPQGRSAFGPTIADIHLLATPPPRWA